MSLFSLPPFRGWLRLLRVALPGLFCLPSFHLVPLNQQVLEILTRTFVESFKHSSILRFAVLKLTKLLLDSKLLDVGDHLYHVRCVSCSWETEKIKKYS